MIGIYGACSLGSALSVNAEQYLCVADKSTGFKWNETEWASVDFIVSEKRFVIQGDLAVDTKEMGHRHFATKNIGNNTTQHECSRQENADYTSNRIIRGGLGIGLLVDTKTLRFQELHGIGFLEGDKEGNTPALTRGKCTRLD
jgi:hypothetical protein